MSRSTKEEKRSGSCCLTCENSSNETKGATTKPKTVLVFGVFDLLHLGHVAFLQEARSRGDRLAVVVTRDERVVHEKGSAPFFGIEERVAMLRSLSCVDEAVPGDPSGEWGMVRNIAPDVICVGHDQRTDHPKFLAQLDGLEIKPELIRLPAFNRDIYSSSRLKRILFDRIRAAEESQ